MRPSAPPPPTDPFDRLLRRVAGDAHRAWIDPDLSARVERTIRARQAGSPILARLVPRVVAAAAVILLAAGVGPSAPGLEAAATAPPRVAPAPPPIDRGPEVPEARNEEEPPIERRRPP